MVEVLCCTFGTPFNLHNYPIPQRAWSFFRLYSNTMSYQSDFVFLFFIDLPAPALIYWMISVPISIDSAQFTNLVIVDDFNVDMSTCSHPLFQKVNNITDTYCLSQMVTQFTHVHHNGTKSIIDLLFVSDPQLVRSCFTIPPLSNSDHCGLNIELNLKTIPKASKRRTVWRYCHADWEKAHRLIEGTNWDSLLDPEDINTSWKNWSAKFLEIMRSSIPTTTLPPRRNRPWLTKKLVQAIRRRNALFKRAKATNDFTKYRQHRNKIVNYLRSAKQAYFGNLNPRKPKEFWKACKLLSKTSSIPVLTNNNSTAYTNVDKAEQLIFCLMFQ